MIRYFSSTLKKETEFFLFKTASFFFFERNKFSLCFFILIIYLIEILTSFRIQINSFQ